MSIHGAPTVLVVQHEESAPLGRFGPWLVDAGLRLDVRRADLEELPALGTGTTAYDGLVVLGGAMAPDADEANPWLPLVRRRISEAARRGIPTLGICLGHQLAALALGGDVERNPHGRTIGLRQVDWEPAVFFDPLVRGIAGDDRAVHWNEDVVVELPPGAELLATTLDGQVQAARLAPTVWGVQFHPEVDAAIVGGWAAGSTEALAALGMTAAQVVDEVVAAEAGLHRSWQRLAAAYAVLVRGRAAAADTAGLPGRDR